MSADIIPFRIERQQDGELRISDVELGERIGYARPRDFRKLVIQHIDTLRLFGICAPRSQIHEGAGRPGKEYWLTEQQALYLCAKANTSVANTITVQMVRGFAQQRRETQKTVPVREWLQLTILNETASIWEKEYPSGFFDELHRVMGLRKPGRNNHSNCAHFINRYVYTHLFGALGLDVIREANPADDEYRRAVRHHQVLKEKHKPALRQHIDRIGTMLPLSVSLAHFDDQFNARFPSPDTQIGFVFRETPVSEAATHGA